MLTRSAHRAIPIVVTAAAIDVIGFGIIAPVLPALITSLGAVDLASATRIGGWLLATFALAQFFAGPIVGSLGDRFGRRPVLLACMICFALDYALQAVAPTLAWLFLGRAIAGVTGAIYGPAGAVIADVLPPEKRAAGYGQLGVAFGIGFIIGPALGGLLAEFGPRVPFIAAAVLAALNAAAMYFLLPETLKAENRRPFRLQDANVIGAFKPLFQVGNAAPLLVAWFLWQLGSIVYPATWSFWATIRFGWGPREIGWSLAWVGLLISAVQFGLTGRVVAALGERRTAIIGLACGASCILAYAFTTQEWQVYAFFLVGALGALGWPAMNGILSRMVDATRQGALQGGIGSMNSVAAVLGPLLASQSLAYGSQRGFVGAAFLVAGTLIGVAALIIAVMVPHFRDAEPMGAAG
jgi:MFS transporter, DHA1 family, tetracycline resistance protein